MKRILLVDDSAFVAKLLRRVVESIGHEVVDIAKDGQEGFESHQRHQPDITLLDITMPNVDGLDCLKQIRSVSPDAIVIMISAVRTPETVEQCLEAGAVAFLQKPIRPDSPEDIQRLKTTLDQSTLDQTTADSSSVASP